MPAEPALQRQDARSTCGTPSSFGLALLYLMVQRVAVFLSELRGLVLPFLEHPLDAAQVCCGFALARSAGVRSRPASSPPSPFCRTGRRPGRPGCTKSSGTAIASWPAKMATASMGAHDVGLLRCFHPHRTAVAALPVDTAVLDGEAIVLRSDHTSDFDALRSRQGAG
jgi:hypothetical protein